MPEAGNPFVPGQPVDHPALFFGRREAIAWISDNLVKGRRLLLVSGAPRIGKTSLLHQLSHHLPASYTAVRVELLDEAPAALDRLLWRVADLVAQQLAFELKRDVPRPDWADFEGHTERLAAGFWPRVRATLGPVQPFVLLLLDDLDSLALSGAGGLLEPALSVLRAWSEGDPDLALIATLSHTPHELLPDRAPGTLGTGLPIYTLEPLLGDDAARLMTQPVEGVLTYDYGVARRVVEVTSGQPYYLQLVGFELFNRCAASGWVNQRDVDAVVSELLRREIVDFRQVWDGSSAQEQAVLAALVSLRVSRGVATAAEVHTLLANSGARADRRQVAEVVEGLAARGVLERLGALSYRFRINLLSDWLRERVDLPRLARGTRWARERPAAEPPERKPVAARPEAAKAEEETGTRRRAARPRWLWPAAGGTLGLVLLVVVLAAALSGGPARPPAGQTAGPAGSTATARPPTARPEITASGAAVGLPTDRPAAASSATPAHTPTPTPPVVVSRPIPAIAYQSRVRPEDVWSIYVMSSNGSNPLRLTDEQARAMSPVWSPDGGRIAYVSDRDGSADIWVMNADGSGQTNLSRHPAQDQWPAWSPDGQWLAFASVRDAPYWELYVMRADGSDVRRLTYWQDASDLAPSWSPDGKRIAFATKRDGNWEIYAMDRDGGNLLRLTTDPSDETNPAWSPDGRLIAFESTRTGYADIFVMPATGGEAVNVTNHALASDHGPTWSPDGSRLAFFSDRDGEWDVYVMAADGSDVAKLTGEDTLDQGPAWRP